MNRLVSTFVMIAAFLNLVSIGQAQSKDFKSEDVRFVILGDSQFSYPDVFERMVHEVEMQRPDFVIQVGDLINGYTYNKDILHKEWIRYKHQIEPLTAPFHPVPGNHDVVTTASEEVYIETWGKDKLIYSFDYGHVHCIALDSFYGSEDDRIKKWQRDWLKNDLEKYAEENGGKGSEELNKKSIFIFLHSPLWRYDKETPGRKDWDIIHEMLKEYPVRLVVGGHTHEYVSDPVDGIGYLVMNSSGGSINLERGGKFFCYVIVSVLPNGDCRYAVMKAGSALPLDTVDSHDRSTVPRYSLSGGTLRVSNWETGKPVETSVTVPIANKLKEDRTYHLQWEIPREADVTITPAETWIDLKGGDKTEVAFKIESPSAPSPGNMPTLEVSSEKILRTGVVNREWEKIYRENIEKAKSDPSVFTTEIPLDAPVTFKAYWHLFLPKTVTAKRRSGEIKIDGKFDEAAWQNAGTIENFSNEADQALGIKTTAKFLWDDDYLYIAARLDEPNTKNLTTNADGLIALTWDDDDIEFFFDPGVTQSEYSRLFINAAGTRFNSMPRHIADKYFKSAYTSEILIDDDYWAVEMQIPWSDIYNTKTPKVGEQWGFNVGRHRQQGTPKRSEWAGSLYNPSNYGLLIFE